VRGDTGGRSGDCDGEGEPETSVGEVERVRGNVFVGDGMVNAGMLQRQRREAGRLGVCE
jgi:hypothetical protein